MIALLLGLLLQTEPMDALVRRFSDDDPARRDEATRAIVGRWKEWNDADLALLRKSSENADEELATRARDALAAIDLRRRLGESLLAKITGLEDAIRSGTDDQRVEILAAAARRWRRKECSDAELRILSRLAVDGRWSLGYADRMKLVWPGREEALVGPYAPLVVPLLGDPDADHRAWAAETLGRMGAREYAPGVAALLKEAEKAPRLVAMAALVSMGAREQAPAIAEMLDPTEAYEIRLGAVDALLRLRGIDPYLARVVPFLADGSPEVIRRAVDALGQTGARPQATRVREYLRNNSPAARAAAAEVLGRMGAQDSAEAVAALLDDEACRRVAIEALGRMGAREQAEAVAPFLGDSDEWVRSEAARALGRMGAKDRASLLLPLLSEASITVSWKATHALGELITGESDQEIARLLSSETRVVRGLAAHVLGRAGAVARADEIAALLEEPQPFVRGEAAKALGTLGAVKHAKAMVALLEDDFNEARIDAGVALAWLAASPMAEKDRAELVGLLVQAEDNLGGAPLHAVRVALACHGKGGAPFQLEVLKGMRESGQDFPEVLLEGLVRLHEKSAAEKLTRPLKIDRAVDSIDRLQELFRSVGLRLETSEPMAGRIPPGIRTTARRLAQNLWESQVLVAQGDRVRLLSLDEAFDYWEKRLAGK